MGVNLFQYKTFYVRAFCVLLRNNLEGLLKFSYICIVNEKRQNLRPNWATKIAKRTGTCFLGKAKNEVDSEISKNILLFD